MMNTDLPPQKLQFSRDVKLYTKKHLPNMSALGETDEDPHEVMKKFHPEMFKASRRSWKKKGKEAISNRSYVHTLKILNTLVVNQWT